MKRIGELAPMLVADRQARTGLMPPWAIGKNAKEYRAAMGRQADRSASSASAWRSAYRWKDSVQSADEIRLWVADCVANGMRPWFTKFAGVLHDQRWLKPVEDLYRMVSRCGALPAQRAAARPSGPRLFPADGLVLCRRPASRNAVEDPALGWYQALIEARIPFEMVHDRLLDPEHLAPFKTLILPNIAALSMAQCASSARSCGAAAAWWRRTRPRSTTSRGKPRDDFGLADLFGVSFVGRRDGPDAATPICASSTRRPRAIPAARARGRAADHPRRLAARGEGEACRSRTRP